MKIFFNCTTAELMKYKENYLKIRDIIINEGHILTRDWIPKAVEKVERRDQYQNPQSFFPKVMSAMEEADVIVVEDTVSNFSTGFAITYAIQRRKPVLVLWFREKNKHFKDNLLQGVDSDYLEIKKYSLESAEGDVKSFLNKYENAIDKTRFHLVIDGVERKYLDWVNFNTGESRTKIIRKSIRKLIESDSEYSKYLQKE